MQELIAKLLLRYFFLNALGIVVKATDLMKDFIKFYMCAVVKSSFYLVRVCLQFVKALQKPV